MQKRNYLAAAVILGTIGAASSAHAQIATTPPMTATADGWSFAVTPYAWLPTLSSTVNYTGPRGGTVTNDTSSGIGDYLSKLNFALMVGGEARYDRFTVMSDLVYANASLTTSDTHLSRINLGPGPVYLPRSQQLDTGTRLATTIWSVAGGYTLLEGDWGYVDAVAGMRILFLGSTTNYTLTADVQLPDRTLGLTRTGSLNLNATAPEGIGGVTGRINIPNSSFYVPFYFDAGGGAVPFTWQAYGAVAYQATSYLDISAGYRYLAFQNGSKTNEGVSKLALGGAIIAANFHF